jgi:hypothetical protein
MKTKTQGENHMASGIRVAPKAATAIAASLCVFSAVTANAAVTTTGCSELTSCTLTELFGGGSIEVNGVLFSDWTLDFDGYASAVDTDAITVVGSDFDPDTAMLFYDSIAAFDVPTDDIGVYSLSYTLTTAPSAAINGAYLDLTGSVIAPDPGLVELTTTLDGVASLLAFDDRFNGDAELSDEAEFAGVGSAIDVETFLFIEAGDAPGGLYGLDSFTQEFAIVPVPGAVWMLLSGLGALGFARRRAASGAVAPGC